DRVDIEQDKGDEVITHKKKTEIHIDIRTILRTCPEFATWSENIGHCVNSWHDLANAAAKLGPMIGLPSLTLHDAASSLGKQTASAAVALIFDKHIAGIVASPGAYLSGMMRKARAGALHLERSFHGRLKIGVE